VGVLSLSLGGYEHDQGERGYKLSVDPQELGIQVSELKVGDHCRHHSGGPLMIVTLVEQFTPPTICCTFWSEVQGEFKEQQFEREELYTEEEMGIETL